MTILLGLAFCCISPLITPFCLLYFALVAVAQRYQLLYVLSAPYEANGRLWMNVSSWWVGVGQLCGRFSLLRLDGCPTITT
jgi:hypothetical protein